MVLLAVTFAIVAAIAVHRLVLRRAWWSAVVAVVSVVVPVLPLTLAIPIQCSDGDAVPDLRIVALGLGLLGIVGWLAILARLQERAGDTRGDAERRVLWSGALLVPGMLVEFVASAITLAIRCNGTSEPVIAHLAVAAVVFTVLPARRSYGIVSTNSRARSVHRHATVSPGRLLRGRARDRLWHPPHTDRGELRRQPIPRSPGRR